MSNDIEDIVVEDDNFSHVSYFPSDAFAYGQGPSQSMFRSNSYHVTHTAGAYINFTFTGNYVAYHSDFNYDHADCSIAIDGRQVATANSYAPQWTSPSTKALFASSLASGSHTVIITNPANGTYMGLDYFIYRAAAVALPSTSNPASSPPHSPSISTVSVSTVPQSPSDVSTAPSSATDSPSHPATSTPETAVNDGATVSVTITPTLPAAATTSTPDAPGARNGTVFLIAGVASGVSVALCCLAVLGFFCQRRARKKRTATQRPILDFPEVPQEPPPYTESSTPSDQHWQDMPNARRYFPSESMSVISTRLSLPASPTVVSEKRRRI